MTLEAEMTTLLTVDLESVSRDLPITRILQMLGVDAKTMSCVTNSVTLFQLH